MSRQRFIHPELFQSEDFLSLSHGARLLFIGLFTLADDHGRGKGSAKYLCGSIFPGENIQATKIVEWCRAITARAMARFYSVAGSIYYDLPSWPKWQKPKWKKDSVIPQFNSVPAFEPNDGNRTGDIPGPDRGHSGTGPGPDRGTGSCCVVVGDGEGSGRDGIEKNTPPTPLDDPTAPHPKPRSARPRRKAARPVPVFTERFLRLWTGYPNHAKKAAAFEAFEEIAPDDATLDAMISWRDRMCGSPKWAEGGGRFVPMLVTALNNKRWLDEADAEVQAMGKHTANNMQAIKGAKDILRRSEGDPSRLLLGMRQEKS